jgi:hypothetical protein
MHSLDERIFPGRTRWSCPVDILTTSVALGSSEIKGLSKLCREAFEEHKTHAKPCQLLRVSIEVSTTQKRMREYRRFRKMFMTEVKEMDITRDLLIDSTRARTAWPGYP